MRKILNGAGERVAMSSEGAVCMHFFVSSSSLLLFWVRFMRVYVNSEASSSTTFMNAFKLSFVYGHVVHLSRFAEYIRHDSIQIKEKKRPSARGSR